MKNNSPSQLSDADLVAEVNRLVRNERETTVTLIIHLAEFDVRGLHLGAGFSSLFADCTEVLRLSEAEAYNRIQAARVARAFPVILELLGEAALNLTSVRLLAPHLTSDNHQELLQGACGKSKREVEELVARHFPQRDVPSLVRKLPAPKMIAPAPAAPSVVATAVLPRRRCVLLSSLPLRRIDIKSALLRAPRRARSSGVPRISSDTPCQTGTWRRSSIARSPLFSRTWPGRSSPRPRSPGPAERPRRPPATFQRRSGGR